MIHGQRVVDGPTETERGLPLPVTGRALTSDPACTSIMSAICT